MGDLRERGSAFQSEGAVKEKEERALAREREKEKRVSMQKRNGVIGPGHEER